MAEYLLINDVHLSDRPPSSCTDTYTDDLFALLAQISELAQSRRVEAIVIAGDLFHCKAPSRVSHRLVKRFMDWARHAGAPVFAVAGNHDIQHDRLESLDETQPLGVLISSGAVRLLEGWDFRDGGGYGSQPVLYGVPWQQTWDDEHVFAVLERYRPSLHDHAGPALVVTHAPLYPPGLELEYENYPAGKFAAAMGGEGSCYYGHVHERHGIWRCAASWETETTIENRVVTFCNPGALSRGSLHEHNLTRVPACVIWDSGTGQFTEIPLKARPPEEVFRLTEAKQVTDMHGRLDEFLEGIRSASLEVMSVESVVTHIRGLGLSEADTTLAIDLLMEASHDS